MAKLRRRASPEGCLCRQPFLISSDTCRFSGHPEYVKAFANGLSALAAAECDILLTPHPSASAMREKLQRGDLAGGGASQCRAYAQRKSADLQARLAKEAQRGG